MSRRIRVLVVMAVVAGVATVVSAATVSYEGVAAIAAGSINPPNPVDGCNRAKQDAEQKAAAAGTKGLASWERLSVDSDCSLSTEGATGKGYFYIFKAKGNFTQ
jgi:hypothetical protein